MNFDYLKKMVDSKNIGICVKSLEGVVLCQNETCRKICGDNETRICATGCMLLYQKENEGKSNVGTQLFRNQSAKGSLYDVLVLNDGKQIVSILCLLNEKVKTDLSYFDRFGLTKREREIVELVIQGSNNKQIMKKLFISKPTVKTHLNNIYKKIPEHSITVLRNQGQKKNPGLTRFTAEPEKSDSAVN